MLVDDKINACEKSRYKKFLYGYRVNNCDEYLEMYELDNICEMSDDELEDYFEREQERMIDEYYSDHE